MSYDRIRRSLSMMVVGIVLLMSLLNVVVSGLTTTHIPTAGERFSIGSGAGQGFVWGEATGIAKDPNQVGSFYFCASDRIKRYDITTGVITSFYGTSPGHTAVTECRGIVVDKAGRYMYYNGASMVWQIDLQDLTKAPVATNNAPVGQRWDTEGYNAPYDLIGLQIDEEDTLYVDVFSPEETLNECVWKLSVGSAGSPGPWVKFSDNWPVYFNFEKVDSFVLNHRIGTNRTFYAGAWSQFFDGNLNHPGAGLFRASSFSPDIPMRLYQHLSPLLDYVTWKPIRSMAILSADDTSMRFLFNNHSSLIEMEMSVNPITNTQNITFVRYW